jgi:hypothetical protein
MKYKFLVLMLLTANGYTLEDYKQFQSFNNALSIGFGISRLNLSNGSDSALVSGVSYQLDIERLFNNGIWMDLNSSVVVSSLTSQSIGTGSSASLKSPFNQNPDLGGINLNLGYSYLMSDDLLVTPFFNLGRNTNLASSTVYFNNNKNISNDFYYTLGVGSRIDYIINKSVMLYIKPYIDYNWDQSGPINGVMPQNNLTYNIMLGSKFDVYKNFQIGLNGYYSYYQQMSDLPIDKYTNKPIYTANSNSGYGGNITFGLVY